MTMQAAIPSNAELVQKRLQMAHEKKAARMLSMEQERERNLQIKRLLHSNNQSSNATSSNYNVPPLYAIKVTVCDELRQELKLSGREKRGRVFIQQDSDAIHSLKALQQEMHAFFRALRKQSYLMSAGFPQIDEDGTLSAAKDVWPLFTDQDVQETFRKADEFFREHPAILPRPSMAIHVHRDPNAPPPPSPPAWLQNMPDPSQSPSMTMLSFYSFPPQGIEDPESFAETLRKAWKPFKALGRIYVATEGVNAQMSIPTNIIENFRECCRSIPELGEYMENGINIDPVPLSKEDFAVAGVPVNGEPAPPFRNLHVRVRNQIVADGLDKSLNWQSAGYDMPPLEWHAKLKEAREARLQGKEDNVPLLFDCRNIYETDVGRFEGADPLDTENFRDSWDVFKDRLKDVPKDAPIMTYCTGGIRCVKVGAYLTQELGFTNVSRLAGGIIAYDRTLNEKAKEEESLFKGTNFVFDGRLGRPITEDALGSCVTCGSETSLVSNCRNENCHQRIIQCETCRTTFHGTCSDACKQRVVNGVMMPRRQSTSTVQSDDDSTNRRLFTSLDDYSEGHSSPPPSVYPELEHNTRVLIPSGSHMVSGNAQGRLLKQLASMTREGRVLELGTFTGYATACLLEGATITGQQIQSATCGREGGPYVLSMERDSKAFDIAVAHLRTICELGTGEAAAEAICVMRNSPSAVVSTRQVELRTPEGTALELLRVTDALASVEEMAAGRGMLQPAPFDLVFVDADKTRLLDYVEACLSSDRVLKKGGLIVVDNVLWKGLVLEASNGDFSSIIEGNDTEENELRKSRRAKKLANKMHRFNAEIVKDERVEVLLLPMRDGLSVIRKK